MSENDPSPPIACTLTEKQEADRSEAVRRTLISHYIEADELEDGYTIHFTGAEEALVAVAEFVASELQCCAFADYTITVTPPYEETKLTITGPGETKDMFGEGLVDQLEAASA